MSKYINDDAMDALLNYIKNNATKICICSALPTTYLQANETYMLAQGAITSSDFTGPADGDTSGRKLTVAAKTTEAATTQGTGTHVALIDTANSKLLHATSIPSGSQQIVYVGNAVNIPSFKVDEVADLS